MDNRAWRAGMTEAMKNRSRKRWKLCAGILLLCAVLGVSIYYGVTVSNAATITVGTVATNSSPLSVRKGPGTSYTKIGSLTKGSQVTIIGEEGDWYKILFGSGEGYVYKTYISDVHTVEENPPDENYIQWLVDQGFPTSYAEKLAVLHSKYPNWKFKPVITGLNWNEVVAGESKVGLNMVPNSFNDARKSVEEGAYDWATNTWAIYDGDSWVSAASDYVAYCMDPRNWMDDASIFQFEALSYEAYQNKDGVALILKNTFMAGNFKDGTGNYTDTFYDLGVEFGISPYHLASRCRQEQGVAGNSAMISGTYPGYEGYYNYFNIGAYGSTSTTVLTRGLTTAKKYGWNSIYKSLRGGSERIAAGYVAKGQDTIYFEKFNVVNRSNLYDHQYMANVLAAINEGKSVSKAYPDKTQAIVFKIPVYSNMPEKAVTFADTGNPNNWLSSLEVSGCNLTPTFRGSETNYSVIVEEGISSVTVAGKAVATTSTVSGNGSYALNYGNNQITITCKAQNGNARSYVINIVRTEPDDDKITVAPGATIAIDYRIDDYVSGLKIGMNAQELLNGIRTENCSVKVVNSVGAEQTGIVGTGNKLQVWVNGQIVKEYGIVIYGDINGNGTITNADLIRIKRHILGSTPLKDEYLRAADTNQNGNITNADLILIKRHILGSKEITQ